jgi:ParB family transcriptional regulator, chromosome partitioning protein
MTAKSKNRRAFSYARDNLWSIDPMEIGIVGGKCLPEEEQGPRDTEVDKTHDLWDKRLKIALTEEFVASIYSRGVLEPVLIVKIGDHPFVSAGRRRVRAARRANIARKKAGEPLLMVSCKMRRSTGVVLKEEAIIENEHRLNDDVPTKIEKAMDLLDKGVSEEKVGEIFGVGPNIVRGWKAYQDCATDEVKAAVNAGRLSAHAAATLAKLAEPDEQRAKLAELITSGEKVTARKIQTAAKVARGEATGVADKKTQKKLLQIVQAAPHPNSGEKSLAFWEGAEEMLKLVLGAEDVDSRLTGKLDETVALMKTEKREKAKRK